MINPNTIFIHYGASQFNPNEGFPIKNRTDSYLKNKPVGGLWASRIDEKFGWKEFCQETDFRLDSLKTHFTFTIKPDSNVITINKSYNLSIQPWYHIIRYLDESFVDYQYLVKNHVDALELTDYSSFKDLLYGWDCNCIVILNPNIVIPT